MLSWATYGVRTETEHEQKLNGTKGWVGGYCTEDLGHLLGAAVICPSPGQTSIFGVDHGPHQETPGDQHRGIRRGCLALSAVVKYVRTYGTKEWNHRKVVCWPETPQRRSLSYHVNASLVTDSLAS